MAPRSSLGVRSPVRPPGGRRAQKLARPRAGAYARIRMLRASSTEPLALAALAALVTFSALAAGCAHETAAARHESDLRDGFARTQSEADRLHLQGDDDDAPLVLAGRSLAAPAGGAAADGGVRPPFTRTIHLGGGDDGAEDDDPNAPSARPKIELSGSPGAAARRAPRERDGRDGRDRAPSMSPTSPTSTGRARDTRIEMLGPVLDTEGEPPVVVGPATSPGETPPAPAEASPRDVRPDSKSEAPKNDAGKRRGSRDAQGREKPRPTDPKAPKETR